MIKKNMMTIKKYELVYLFIISLFILIVLTNSIRAYYPGSDLSTPYEYYKEYYACSKNLPSGPDNSGVTTCYLNYAPPNPFGQTGDYVPMNLTGRCTKVGSRADGTPIRMCIIRRYMYDSFGLYNGKYANGLLERVLNVQGVNNGVRLKFNPQLYSNSPTDRQGNFSNGEYSAFISPFNNYLDESETAARLMLNSISTPDKTYQFLYGVDTWKYSRGDNTNYYSSNNDVNYGGGVHVNKITTTFNTGSPLKLIELIDYYNGTLNTVPIKTGGYMDEKDMRRRSHRGSKYTSGSILYESSNDFLCSNNEFDCHEDTGEAGVITNYFSTIKSTPANTNGLINFNTNDYNVGLLIKRFDTNIISSGPNSKCIYVGINISTFFAPIDEGPCQDPISRIHYFGFTVPAETSVDANFSYNEFFQLLYPELYNSTGRKLADAMDIQRASCHDKSIATFYNITTVINESYNPLTNTCEEDILTGIPDCPLNVQLSGPTTTCKCGTYRIFNRSKLDSGVECVNRETLTNTTKELVQINPDAMGAAAGVSRFWARGNNYRTIIATPNFKKDIKRNFLEKDAIYVRMGTSRVNKSYVFADPTSFTGLAAGFLIPKNMSMTTTMTNSPGEKIFNYIKYENFSYFRGDSNLMKSNQINYDNSLRLKNYELSVGSTNARETQPSLKNDLSFNKKHILQLKGKTFVKDDSGNILSETKMHYVKSFEGNYLTDTISKINPSNGFEIKKRFTYYSNGWVKTITTSDGITNHLKYNVWGKLKKRWGVDSNGNSVEGSESKPALENFYDTRGFLIKQIKYIGNKNITMSYDVDSLGRVTKVYSGEKSLNDVITKKTYYDLNTPFKVVTDTRISGNNYQETVEYFLGDKIIYRGTKNSNGNFTFISYIYDALHGLIAVSKPFTVLLQQDFSGMATFDGHNDHYSVRYIYEPTIDGRLIKKIYADGNVTIFNYSIENGLPVTTTTAPNGVVKKIFYNLKGKAIRLTEKISGKNINSYFIYNSDDKLIKVIDPLGRTESEITQGFWGVDSITTLDGGRTDFVYNPNTGKVETKKFPDYSTSINYDIKGNIKQIIFNSN